MSRIRARRRGGPVAGLVLAGGRGRRAGGVDKGMVHHLGRPMAAHVAERLAPWCDAMVVSANRNHGRYRRLADRVVADRMADFPGPLAGIATALSAVRARRWLVCPCDVVDLPGQAPGRLLRALRLNAGVSVAVLHDAERLQPLVLALRGHLAPDIFDYLSDGGRSVHGWLERMPVAVVHTPHVLGNRNVVFPERLRRDRASGARLSRTKFGRVALRALRDRGARTSSRPGR